MNMSFYTAAVGAQQQQRRLDVHGNNIANVNTYGFTAKKPVFKALINDFMAGAECAELPRGTGSCMIAADSSFRANGIPETGRPLDYAIEGDGFFALWEPQTGEYSYTRDGSFIMSSFQREVTDDNGEPALNEDGTQQYETVWYLSDALGRFVLSDEGRLIEVTDPKEMLPVGIFDFINVNGMLSVGDNRFVPIDKNEPVRVGTGKLIQGHLLASNTDLANEIAKVIESQRSFSYALKMVQTSDEIETTVNNLR